MQYSLSHLPFQSFSLSGGLITVPDWLLATTLLGNLLKASGTLILPCGLSVTCLIHKLILFLLICPSGVDTMYDWEVDAG